MAILQIQSSTGMKVEGPNRTLEGKGLRMEGAAFDNPREIPGQGTATGSKNDEVIDD